MKKQNLTIELVICFISLFVIGFLLGMTMEKYVINSINQKDDLKIIDRNGTFIFSTNFTITWEYCSSECFMKFKSFVKNGNENKYLNDSYLQYLIKNKIVSQENCEKCK